MLNLNWNIIWTFVNLIILYILLRKFLFGPITAMMEKRDEIISKAKEDAGNIVLNANKQIELEKERSISEAKSEIASLVMDAALKAAKNGDVSESAVDSFILEVGEAK